MKKMVIWIVASVLALNSINVNAHNNVAAHKADFYKVLGFKQNSQLDEWMKFISSSMIDDRNGEVLPEYGNKNFYDYLKKEFPGFQCKHRLLFHWGFNAEPWSNALQQRINMLPWSNDEEKVKKFKGIIIKEQQRRNKRALDKTEKLFGFASGGKDASFANALLSIVYDVHLLGDYLPPPVNSDYDGLQNFPAVVGDINNSIVRLDNRLSGNLVKKIKKISNNISLSEQERAKQLLKLLYDEMPRFLKNAQNGSLARRFVNKGFDLID